MENILFSKERATSFEKLQRPILGPIIGPIFSKA
jgi:hypothetical protein